MNGIVPLLNGTLTDKKFPVADEIFKKFFGEVKRSKKTKII